MVPPESRISQWSHTHIYTHTLTIHTHISLVHTYRVTKSNQRTDWIMTRPHGCTCNDACNDKEIHDTERCPSHALLCTLSRGGRHCACHEQEEDDPEFDRGGPTTRPQSGGGVGRSHTTKPERVNQRCVHSRYLNDRSLTYFGTQHHVMHPEFDVAERCLLRSHSCVHQQHSRRTHPGQRPCPQQGTALQENRARRRRRRCVLQQASRTANGTGFSSKNVAMGWLHAYPTHNTHAHTLHLCLNWKSLERDLSARTPGTHTHTSHVFALFPGHLPPAAR